MSVKRAQQVPMRCASPFLACMTAPLLHMFLRWVHGVFYITERAWSQSAIGNRRCSA